MNTDIISPLDYFAKRKAKRERKYANSQNINQNCDNNSKIYQLTLTNISNESQTISIFNSVLELASNDIENSYDYTNLSTPYTVDTVNTVFYNDTLFTLQGGTYLVGYDSGNNITVNFDLSSISGITNGGAITLDTSRGYIAVSESSSSRIWVYDLNDSYSLIGFCSPTVNTIRDIIYCEVTDSYFTTSQTVIEVFNASDLSLTSTITPSVGTGGSFNGRRLEYYNGNIYFSDQRALNSRLVCINESTLEVSYITVSLSRTFGVGINIDNGVILVNDGLSNGEFSYISSQTQNELGTFAASFTQPLFDIIYSSNTKQFLVGSSVIIAVYDNEYNEVQQISVSSSGNCVSFGIRTSDNSIFAIHDSADISYLSENITEGAIQFTDISGYNFFNLSSGNDPKIVSCMNFVSENQNQLINPVLITKKDANGIEFQENKLLNTQISIWQKQSTRALLLTKKLILDVNTSISYTINSHETVSIIVYYRDFKKIQFLNNFYNLSSYYLRGYNNSSIKIKKNISNIKKMRNFEANLIGENNKILFSDVKKHYSSLIGDTPIKRTRNVPIFPLDYFVKENKMCNNE